MFFWWKYIWLISDTVLLSHYKLCWCKGWRSLQGLFFLFYWFYFFSSSSISIFTTINIITTTNTTTIITIILFFFFISTFTVRPCSEPFIYRCYSIFLYNIPVKSVLITQFLQTRKFRLPKGWSNLPKSQKLSIRVGIQI